MHQSETVVTNWVGVLLLAGVIAAVFAILRRPQLRSWLLGAVGCLALSFIVLKIFWASSYTVVHNVGDGAPVVHYASGRSSVGLVVLLPLIAGGAWLAARRHGHAGGALAVAAIAVAAALFGMFGWARREAVQSATLTAAAESHAQQTFAIASEAAVSLHQLAAERPAEEPLDELWDRLNRPRIQLTAAQDDATEAESTPEANDSDAESATAHVGAAHEAHGDAASNAEPAVTTPSSDHSHDDEPVEVAAAEPAPEPTPEPRPSWVGQPPRTIENIYRVPVEAGLHASLEDCYRELREELRLAVQQRLVDVVRETTGKPYVNVPSLEWMRIGNAYIDRELLTDQYVETRDTSVGPMMTAWGLLEFTPEQDQRLVAAWKTYARREGIAVTSAVAAGVLAVLGGALALLKIDTWTRGYYSKQLFLGVPAAIIAVVLLISAMAP